MSAELPLARREALENVSEMIEEIWGGLVVAIEDNGCDRTAVNAMLSGMLRIASEARGEVEIAMGNMVRT